MAVLTALRDGDVRDVAAGYGLIGPLGVSGVPAGSVNSNFELRAGGARYFLRLYEERDLAGAERETAMLDRLAAAGIPTPAPLLRVDGRLVSTVRGKAAALFPWRDGTIRCQASVTVRDVRRVGAALARIHERAGDQPCDSGRFRYEDLLVRLKGIALRGDETFGAVVPELRAALDRAHAARGGGLPGGLIHGDLFRDNVLWDRSGEIAALLDFESACRGAFAYDLMVTLLAWCVGADVDLALAAALIAGYESVRRLEPAERSALWTEGCFAALRFTITRITDYALRTGHAGPRVVKDWRRFLMRYDKLRAFGADGFLRALSVCGAGDRAPAGPREPAAP